MANRHDPVELGTQARCPTVSSSTEPASRAQQPLALGLAPCWSCVCVRRSLLICSLNLLLSLYLCHYVRTILRVASYLSNLSYRYYLHVYLHVYLHRYLHR